MGNIIKFELKNNFVSMLLWTLIAFFISGIYLSIYPTFKTSADEFSKVFESYPKEFLSTLNIDVTNLSSMEGFYPMVIGFLQLVSFAFVSSLTLKVYCNEYKNKSIEFLMTKPRSRKTFFNAKLVSILVISLIYFTLVSAFNFTFIFVVSDMTLKNYLLMQLTVLIVMITAILITTLFSLKFSHLRTYSATGFIIAFAFFAINVLANILDDAKLKIISIYEIFDLNEVVTGYKITDIIILFVFWIILYILMLNLYSRKDVL